MQNVVKVRGGYGEKPSTERSSERQLKRPFMILETLPFCGNDSNQTVEKLVSARQSCKCMLLAVLENNGDAVRNFHAKGGTNDCCFRLQR